VGGHDAAAGCHPRSPRGPSAADGDEDRRCSAPRGQGLADEGSYATADTVVEPDDMTILAGRIKAAERSCHLS
jgi:hypothetical protein